MKDKSNFIGLRKLFLIIVFLVVIGNVTAQKDTFTFLHITDSHLMFNLENYNSDIVYHREHTRNYKEANDRFSKFMQVVPYQTGCDIIIATGDVIDFFDAKTTIGNTIANQVELFARYMDQFHHPFYMTLGNHDIFSYEWGNNRVLPNQLKTAVAKASWIRNFDIFRDGTYYSRSFKIGRTKYRLIFLDNSFYQFEKNENIVNPYIDKPQLHWLKAELSSSRDEQIIILMHVPFTKQSALPESNNELYNVLVSEPSVQLILAGHNHKNSVIKLQQPSGHIIIQVTTDALVTGEDKWRLISLTEENILVSSVGTMESEQIIPIK